ncbi:MAG: sugar ABC transporter permease [Ancalomicrobiaceae bacterium]|nr:sugar ABC transporter permease [Ancalomicrobiaceae bacterium]
MAAIDTVSAPDRMTEKRFAARRTARIRRTAALFLLPAALLLALLVAYPLANVIYKSFNAASLVDPTRVGFIGLDNYRTILEDENFLPTLWNTFVWTALSVAGEYALGLASAVALAQPIKGRAFFRGVILIPWIIPIAIAGLNWIWLLNPDYGLINSWLVKSGLMQQPHDWLGAINTALLSVTFVNIWRSFPFYTISLLAALQAVPADLHEAAALDGAGPIRRFWVITLPHLKAVSLTLIFIHIVWTAINFDFIWVMTAGGPLNASETVPVMIYKYAMQDYDVGAASALAAMATGFVATVFFVHRYALARRKDS